LVSPPTPGAACRAKVSVGGEAVSDALDVRVDAQCVAVFLLVQQVNRLFPKPAAPAAALTKECSWCASAIPEKAKRCPHCTSNLAAA